MQDINKKVEIATARCYLFSYAGYQLRASFIWSRAFTNVERWQAKLKRAKPAPSSPNQRPKSTATLAFSIIRESISSGKSCTSKIKPDEISSLGFDNADSGEILLHKVHGISDIPRDIF